MKNTSIAGFTFISSYRGTFSYQVQFKDGSTRRLELRSQREEYRPGECNLPPEEWERQVNGKLGLACVKYFEGDTEELMVAFNRERFKRYQEEVNIIKADPKRYGEYVPEKFQVYIGGAYSLEDRRWVVLHDFETIRTKAGIPEDMCCNPRQSIGQLLLVA